MSTLRSAGKLVGYAIHAPDGDIGKARELYFDDATWAVRYLVVDVGTWLLHRYVLLSPYVLGKPDDGRRFIPVAVTKEQVRHSPKTDMDQPIALQYQARLHKHYGWDFYWGAEAVIGSSNALFTPKEPVNADGSPFDPHLRTTRVVAGHALQAVDGAVGRVEDFLLDTASWTIRSLVVRLDEGNDVAVPTLWVRRIDFETTKVHVDVPAEIVRGCMPFESPMEGTGALAKEAVEARHG